MTVTAACSSPFTPAAPREGHRPPSPGTDRDRGGYHLPRRAQKYPQLAQNEGAAAAREIPLAGGCSPPGPAARGGDGPASPRPGAEPPVPPGAAAPARQVPGPAAPAPHPPPPSGRSSAAAALRFFPHYRYSIPALPSLDAAEPPPEDRAAGGRCRGRRGRGGRAPGAMAAGRAEPPVPQDARTPRGPEGELWGAERGWGAERRRDPPPGNTFRILGSAAPHLTLLKNPKPCRCLRCLGQRGRVQETGASFQIAISKLLQINVKLWVRSPGLNLN